MQIKKNSLFVWFCILTTYITAQTPSFTITNNSNTYSLSCSIPSITLSANPQNLNFTWTDGLFVNLSGTSVTLTTPGNYTVTGTDPISLQSTSQTFSIYPSAPAPQVVLSPSTQAVINCTSNVSFTSVVTNSVPTVHYWYCPSGLVPAGQSAFSSTGSVSVFNTGCGPGVYTLVTTNPLSNCATSHIFSVTSIFGYPSATLTSNTNYVVCGSQISASVCIQSALPSNTLTQAAIFYQFLPPGFTGTYVTNSNACINPTVTGTYTTIVKDGNTFCELKIPFTISSSSLSAPAFVYTVNSGGSVSFSCTSAGSNTNTVYNWYFGDGTFSNGIAPVHTYSNGGIHTVTLNINNTFCSSIQTVNVNLPCVANSNFTLLPSGTAQVWNAYPQYLFNATSVRWDWGDGTFSYQFYPTKYYSSAGMYNICLTVTTTCANSSSTCANYNIYKTTFTPDQMIIAVNVIPPLNVNVSEENQELPGIISVFPNPAKHLLHVSTTIPDGLQEFFLYDYKGALLLKRELGIDENSVDLHFPPGLYFYRISDTRNRFVSGKLLIE